VQEQAAEPHGTAVEQRLTTGGGWRQETDTTASFSATEEEAAAGADGCGAQRPRPAEETVPGGSRRVLDGRRKAATGAADARDGRAADGRMEARGRAPRNERRWRGRR